MADVLSIRLMNQRDNVVRTFNSYVSAEKLVREKARDALVEGFGFAMSCLDNMDEFESLCQEHGIRPTRRKPGLEENVFTRIVKVVYGSEPEGSWVPTSDSNINKYATIMNHVYFNGGRSAGDMAAAYTTSMTEALANARSDENYAIKFIGASETRDRLKSAEQQLESRWQNMLAREERSSNLAIKLDMDGAGIKAGRVELVGKVDENGNLSITGILNKNPAQIESDLKSAYVRPRGRFAYSPLFDLAGMGNLVRPGKNQTREVVVKTDDLGSSMELILRDAQVSNVVSLSPSSNDMDFAHGSVVLTDGMVDALKSMQKELSGANWSLDEWHGKPALKASFVNGQSIDDRLKSRNDKRVEKGQDTFRLPQRYISWRDNNAYLMLDQVYDLSKYANIHNQIPFEEERVVLGKGTRDQITQAINAKEGGKNIHSSNLRVVFKRDAIEFGTRTQIKNSIQGANLTGLDADVTKQMMLNKILLGNTMRAINKMAKNGDCWLQFSPGMVKIRFGGTNQESVARIFLVTQVLG